MNVRQRERHNARAHRKMELIVTNANERFGDLEKALDPFSSDEEIGRTLRQVRELRARLIQLSTKLRAAIEL